MTVFVITLAYDHEGESPIGVASSLEIAKSTVRRLADEYGYEGGDWVTFQKGVKLQFGSTDWIIREEEVSSCAVTTSSKPLARY